MAQPAVYTKLRMAELYIRSSEGLANLMVVGEGCTKVVAAYLPKYRDSALGLNNAFRFLSIGENVCGTFTGMRKLADRQWSLATHHLLYHTIRGVKVLGEWGKSTLLQDPKIRDMLNIAERAGFAAGVIGYYKEYDVANNGKGIQESLAMNEDKTAIDNSKTVEEAVLGENIQTPIESSQALHNIEMYNALSRMAYCMIPLIAHEWKVKKENWMLTSRVVTSVLDMFHFHLMYSIYNEASTSKLK